MNEISLDRFQTVLLNGVNVMTYIEGALVSSEPTQATTDQYDTSIFFGMECVSMGLEYEADIFNEMVEFRNNIIYDYKKLN